MRERMSFTGLDVFDRTLHGTNTWLNELMTLLGSEDRHFAYRCLRGVLHALRDRLTVEEVAQLGAQLPMLIRGVYYEGWDPTAKPDKLRRKDDFLARMEQEWRAASDRPEPEQVARAVFALLARRVTEGEIEDVTHILPAELRDLWPSYAASRG
jgi:uncharacterized protein (DUF2267 family)